MTDSKRTRDERQSDVGEVKGLCSSVEVLVVQNGELHKL